MRGFIQKYFGEIIGGIIGVGGIIATVTSDIATGKENFFIVYILALTLESILTFIAIRYIFIKYSYKRQIDTLISEVSEKDAKIQNLQVKSSEARINENEKNVKAMATIISNLKNASKLNNDLCNRIPKTTASSYATLEALQQGRITDEELLTKEMTRAYDDYANALYDLYKRYTSNLLSYTLNMIEAQLSIEDITNRISASVSLM